MMMIRKKAFTLVELLVVIAIISVLAALLLPSLENALSLARATDCRNRMRQIGMFNTMYGTDYRCIIPTMLSTATDTKNHDPRNYGMRAQQLLYAGGYLPKEDVLTNGRAVVGGETHWGNVAFEWDVQKLISRSPLICPDGYYKANSAGKFTGWGNLATTYEQQMNAVLSFPYVYGYKGSIFPYQAMSTFFSYAYNGHMKTYRRFPGFTQDHLLPLKNLTNSAATVIHFMEFRQDATVEVTWDHLQGSYWNDVGRWRFRHGNISNYACADGHVGVFGAEIMETAATYFPTQPLGYKNGYYGEVRKIIAEDYGLTVIP